MAWNICRCCGETFVYCGISGWNLTDEDWRKLNINGYPPRFCSKECQELSENEKHWEEPRAPAMREYRWE